MAVGKRKCLWGCLEAENTFFLDAVCFCKMEEGHAIIGFFLLIVARIRIETFSPIDLCWRVLLIDPATFNPRTKERYVPNVKVLI